MHLSSTTTTTAVLLLLGATTASAWRAGLWTTDGRNLQVHGTAWPKCNTIQAIPVGQVTFDPATAGVPDPGRICLYSGVDCVSSTVRGCFGKSLTGVPLPNPGTVKSYKIVA
ncbi:hypothetical protein BKA67DRAFT_660224 [Truncatella angustata]|uniref:Uncharacterized protein n=1 Tax=Truncatella angustata TaxID=152316 RepID=A0A9P8UK59_9PEZI|nr:uncharacterized protein BKA67DRAFT_660224 [Truncatella angustata]KAH6653664.1 hypothetical protein BKA67DRAFT_660224 [Truncatella angustata]